jgi:hypothetical protein
MNSNSTLISKGTKCKQKCECAKTPIMAKYLLSESLIYQDVIRAWFKEISNSLRVSSH